MSLKSDTSSVPVTNPNLVDCSVAPPLRMGYDPLYPGMANVQPRNLLRGIVDVTKIDIRQTDIQQGGGQVTFDQLCWSQRRILSSHVAHRLVDTQGFQIGWQGKNICFGTVFSQQFGRVQIIEYAFYHGGLWHLTSQKRNSLLEKSTWVAVPAK